MGTLTVSIDFACESLQRAQYSHTGQTRQNQGSQGTSPATVSHMMMKRDPADNGERGRDLHGNLDDQTDETRRHCDGDETTQTSFLGTSIFSCATDACNDCPDKS